MNHNNRSYYSNTIQEFVIHDFDSIWSKLTAMGRGDLLQTQKQAWVEQIEILKTQLISYKDGYIFFEYSIPRIGKRVDTILLIKGIVFVLEFKAGAKEFHSADTNQAWDYALDLKYFHEESHNLPIVPILIATKADKNDIILSMYDDQVVNPIKSNGNNLSDIC